MNYRQNQFALTLAFAFACLSANAGKPRVYSSRIEYEKALALYNDHLSSYTNYRKKVEFYKNYKVAARETWRLTADEWVDFFQPLLRSHGIYFDNEFIRYKPAAVPKKTIWLNLMPKPGEDYFDFVISEEPIEEAIYNAATYAFDKPGDPPVYREVKKKVRVQSKRAEIPPASTRMPPPEPEPLGDSNAPELPVPAPACDFFMMPDGSKYNRITLEKNWHMLSNQQVFGGNFRVCRK